MKKLILFFLFIVLFRTSVLGQGKEDPISPRFTFYTSIFNYLPDQLNSANFNLGLDAPLRKDQSIYFNLGFIHSYGPSTGIISISAEKNVGLNFKTELKRYLNTKTGFLGTLPKHLPLFPNTGAYHSFEIFSQFTKTTRDETVSERISNSNFPEFEYYQNSYHVYRFTLGLLMNVGYKVVGKSGFSRDFTIGLGAQLVHSFSENRINGDRSWPNQEKEGFIVAKFFDHGTAVMPYIRLRWKLGWSLFKKN